MEPLELRCRWTNATIGVAPEEQIHDPVDAEVYEDDTYLALSADPDLRIPEEHPVRILTEAYAMRPASPGTVVVRSERPLRLLAIVHKLDEDPTWKEEWVAGALEAALAEVDRRGLRSLSLPLLGTVHGRMPMVRSLTLLVDTLRRVSCPSLERIWLKPGRHTPDAVRDFLAELV